MHSITFIRSPYNTKEFWTLLFFLSLFSAFFFYFSFFNSVYTVLTFAVVFCRLQTRVASEESSNYDVCKHNDSTILEIHGSRRLLPIVCHGSTNVYVTERCPGTDGDCIYGEFLNSTMWKYFTFKLKKFSYARIFLRKFKGCQMSHLIYAYKKLFH